MPQRLLGISTGLPSSGYGRAELETAGANLVYEAPADLLLHRRGWRARGGPIAVTHQDPVVAAIGNPP